MAPILACNDQVIKAMGLVRGVTHAEFIRAQDGRIYYLEMAARVGGASIDVLVDKTTGINLWAEWVKLELAKAQGKSYKPPKRRFDHGAILLCLSKQAQPDLSAYDAPEVAWKLRKHHHAGLVLRCDSSARRDDLVTRYKAQMERDFLAVAPPSDKAV
jgi:biotin carboxylase